VIIALLALAGVGNAIGGPAAIAMLRRAVERRRHGLAYGAMQSGAPAGALVAGLALPVVALTVGWRWAFAGAAVISVAAAVEAVRAPDAVDFAGPANAPESEHGRAAGVWAIAAAAALAGAAAIGMVSFLVVYAVDDGMSESAAGLTLAAVSLGAAGSRLAFGALSDRRGGDPLPLAAAIITASAGGFVLIALGGPGPIVAGALIVAALGWGWPGAFTHAVVDRAPDAPAWATGVMMSGLFAGAVTGPLLVGLLADADRFTAAWAISGALALAAGALTFAISRRPPPAHA
jgi:predicted MFS family arabinose efflux permease